MRSAAEADIRRSNLDQRQKAIPIGAGRFVTMHGKYRADGLRVFEAVPKDVKQSLNLAKRGAMQGRMHALRPEWRIVLPGARPAQAATGTPTSGDVGARNDRLASFSLYARELHHLAPLFGLVGQVPTKFGGRGLKGGCA